MDDWDSGPSLQAGGDGSPSCNGCGQTDHTMDACPNGVATYGNENHGDIICFGCGESGHMRSECPTAGPLVCNYCKQPGHMIKDCPEKETLVCNNCGEQGHFQSSCDKPRVISRDHVATMSPEEAWAKLKQAAVERDSDDAKEALQEYVKSLDGTPTYKDIQMGLIDENINLWLIAIEKELLGAFTNMDLQGNTDKKYAISYRFSEKPTRPRERMGWPESREEILSRLDDAGETVESGKRRCYNCDQFGHGAKTCPEPPREKEEEVKLCRNCNGEGHRLRDCPEPRVDRFACRNCGQSGHKATDCEEPPNLDNISCHKCEKTGHMSRDCPEGGGGGVCRNCGQEGHFAKDCEQPRNMDLVTCRNCEKTGHVSRDCPEPKDWSKVQCSNCQKFGHTKVRCREPTVADGDDVPMAEAANAAASSGDFWDTAAVNNDAEDVNMGSGGW